MSESTDIAMLEAGTSLLNNATNVWASGSANKKTRAWNEKMYGRSRADALHDWTMNNFYNSPAEQMERLKAAGLNPNLVYGHGADAQSGGTPQKAEYKDYRPQVPDIKFKTGLQEYLQSRMQDPTIDNLKAQTKLANEAAIQKAAETTRIGIETATSEFELAKSKSLLQTQMDMAKAELEGKNIQNLKTLQENERAAIMQDQNIKESVARIGKMRAEQANTEEAKKEIQARTQQILQSTALQKMDEELRKQGLMPHDPSYQRALMQMIQKMPKWDGTIVSDEQKKWFNSFKWRGDQEKNFGQPRK